MIRWRAETSTMTSAASDAQGLLAAARAIAPVVEAGARDAERAGTLPASTVAALRGCGVFGMLLPRDLGGAELDPVSAVEVLEEIARQDGSTGWCAGIAAISNAIMASRMEGDAAAKHVFARGAATVTAGGYVPRGEALRTDGGWHVRGRYAFGSGCRHADWIAAMGLEHGDPSHPRAFCLPPEQVEIHDNWQSAGLEGTASCDYSVDGVFVPDGYSFALDGPALRGGDVHALPLLSIAYIGHTGFALGLGLRALEEIQRLAHGTKRLASAAPEVAQRPVFQAGLARAEARWRSARLLALDAFGELYEAQRSTGRVTLAQRARVAQAAVNAAEASVAAAEFALRSAGATAVYRDGVLQRCLRDLRTGLQHVAVSEEVWERAGQVALGLARDPFMV
jgi:alkylation response protein AidB-like acyl-CoA dehydrogenase